jgi:stage III sporulation protein AB
MTYLARRAAGPVRPFFAHCARLTERLGEEPFHALWQKAVTEAGADWRAGERSAMMDLGGALGRYDQEAQARALTQTRARLETLLTEAEGERTRQGRVYRALGLACGLAIVIILI